VPRNYWRSGPLSGQQQAQNSLDSYSYCHTWTFIKVLEKVRAATIQTLLHASREHAERSPRFFAVVFIVFPTKYLCRVQSYVWRLPKYWPPIPLSTQRVCPPPAPKAGGTHSPGGEGRGGSIFWKTPDMGLASYSIISLRFSPSLPLSLKFHLNFLISRLVFSLYVAGTLLQLVYASIWERGDGARINKTKTGKRVPLLICSLYALLYLINLSVQCCRARADLPTFCIAIKVYSR
jgi:hypothetical protein